MKKYISLFISLALIIGLIPISFAKEEKPWYSYAIISMENDGIKVGKDFKITGDIYSKGNIDLSKDGEIDGRVYSEGTVRQGKNTIIKGGVAESQKLDEIKIEDDIKITNIDEDIDGVLKKDDSIEINKTITIDKAIYTSANEIRIEKECILNGGIYAPEATDIKISKGFTINGLIYAPKADISIGKDVKVYGSIVGEKIRIEKDAIINYKEYPSIIKPQGKDEVKIKVSDSIEEKLAFNNLENGNDYILDKAISLKGESRAEFSIDSSVYDKFEYSIVKKDNVPNTSDINTWNKVNIEEIKYKDDVMLDKKRNLNHQAYDVNDLKNMSEAEKWNNPQIVYKTPYPTSSIVSSSLTLKKEKYGENQKYIGKDNKSKTRWISNTIFMENRNEGDNYKEASKIWGYFTVPKSGEYNFKSYSDDGLWAYIIVDGAEIPIVGKDVMFKLHGRDSVQYKVGNKTYTGYEYGYDYTLESSGGHTYKYKATGSPKTVKLEKDRFYPIYMEYFNWGGEACFEMQYKLKDESTYKQIPAENFYPSKSNTPSEYAESRFKGTSGEVFPKSQGNYYIAYRAINSKNSSKMEGIVGPFLIEENASLDIKRSIYSMDDKKIEKDKNGVYSISGNKFKIKYEVNPKPIEGVAVEKVNVSNVILETTLPKGLQYANPLENLITDGLRSQNKIDISSILYEYNSKENISYPKTQGSSYTHTIEIKEFGEYTLNEADSVLSYLESDGSKKEYRFDSEKISMSQETQVIKSGLYDEKTNDFKQPQRVTSLMPITLATDISVKSSNPSIEFNMNSLNGDSYDLNKYELDENNNIIKSSVQTKKIKGNSFKIESSNDFKLDINKRYRLIYKVRPDNGDKFYVNVKNETGESKTVVQLDVFELPIIK